MEAVLHRRRQQRVEHRRRPVRRRLCWHKVREARKAVREAGPGRQERREGLLRHALSGSRSLGERDVLDRRHASISGQNRAGP